MRDLNTSMDFTILADENTDDGDRRQLAIFVRIIGSDHRPIEYFLGITRIAISKTAAPVMDIISKFLISKEIQPSYIRFCGLDGTNSMSSEPYVLQRLIKHSLPHAEYTSCCNHWLALCFVHLLKEFPSLVSFDTMLHSVWKLLKYSTIKKEVFNDMQRVYELTPLKVIKACTTRWFTHGEVCWRIMSRFEPLVDALDAIYNEKRCPDVKGVRDALLQPQNICMLLLVAELLVPINYFSKFLQTRSLNYSSIKNKLGSVIERLKLIQEGLEDYDAIDSSLVHFHKVVKFLTISAERKELARPLHNRVFVNVDEIKVKVNNFLYEIG